MTTKQVLEELEKRQLDWNDFEKWMGGQTIGGTLENPDWYETDVERFIRGRGKLPTLD